MYELSVELLSASNNNNNMKYEKQNVISVSHLKMFNKWNFCHYQRYFPPVAHTQCQIIIMEKKIVSNKWLHRVLCNNFVIFISFQIWTLLLFQTMDEIYVYNVYIDSNNADGTNERYLLNIFAEIKVRMMESFQMQLWNFCLFHLFSYCRMGCLIIRW